jgi:hypothetical protein
MFIWSTVMQQMVEMVVEKITARMTANVREKSHGHNHHAMEKLTLSVPWSPCGKTL